MKLKGAKERRSSDLHHCVWPFFLVSCERISSLDNIVVLTNTFFIRHHLISPVSYLISRPVRNANELGFGNLISHSLRKTLILFYNSEKIFTETEAQRLGTRNSFLFNFKSNLVSSFSFFFRTSNNNDVFSSMPHSANSQLNVLFSRLGFSIFAW